MDLSNFSSDSVSTPPWLHFRISSFIGVGHPILNCCVNFFLSREIKYFSLFGTFWRFDVVLNKVELKVSQSATLELAQEDPIRFQVGRLNHSVIAALRSYYFYLSVIVELLCGFYSLKVSRKYHFLAASDRFTKKLVWTENIHSEQDWNLSWMDLSNFYSDSVSTPPWLHFRISGFIGVGHPMLNCCVTFSLFLEKLNIFLFFGLSEGWTLCWIKVSEKCRIQQYSNWRRKTQSDF